MRVHDAGVGIHGLHLGDREVAYRRTRIAGTTSALLWQLSPLARCYSADDVETIMRSAGYSDPVIVGKPADRGRNVIWRIRAKPPSADQDHSVLETKLGTITVTRALARQSPRTSQPVRASRWSMDEFESSPASEAPPAQPSSGKPLGESEQKTPTSAKDGDRPSQEGQPPGQEQSHMDTSEESEGKAAKRAASTPPSSTPKKCKSALFPWKDTFTEVPVPGDGACLFHALSEGLKAVGTTTTSAPKLRATVVTHLRKHEAEYSTFWDKKAPKAGDVPCSSWQEYLGLLAQQGAWGSELEILALACKFQTPIVVYAGDASPVIYNRSGSYPAIALVFRNEHYNWLKGTVPQQLLLEGAQGKPSGLRGGSDSTTEASFATRMSLLRETVDACLPTTPPLALPAQDEMDSPQTVSTCLRAGLGEAQAPDPVELSTLSSENTSQSSQAGVRRRLRCKRPRPPSLPPPLSSPMPPPPVPRPHDLPLESGFRREAHRLLGTWKCPKCNWVSHYKDVRQARSKHINEHHPEEARTMFVRRPMETAFVQRVAGVSYHWTCPLCNLALPQEPSMTIIRSQTLRRWHRLRVHPEAPISQFQIRNQEVQEAKAKRHSVALRNRHVAKEIHAQRIEQNEGHAELVRMPAVGSYATRLRAITYGCLRCRKIGPRFVLKGMRCQRESARHYQRAINIVREALKDAEGARKEALERELAFRSFEPYSPEPQGPPGASSVEQAGPATRAGAASSQSLSS